MRVCTIAWIHTRAGKGRTPTSDVLISDRPEYPSRLTNLFIPSTVQPKSTLLLRPFNRYIFYIRMRIYFQVSSFKFIKKNWENTKYDVPLLAFATCKCKGTGKAVQFGPWSLVVVQWKNLIIFPWISRGRFHLEGQAHRRSWGERSFWWGACVLLINFLTNLFLKIRDISSRHGKTLTKLKISRQSQLFQFL